MLLDNNVILLGDSYLYQSVDEKLQLYYHFGVFALGMLLIGFMSFL
jgi:hypothetical protein